MFKHKSFILLIMVLLIACLVFAGCSPSDENTATDDSTTTDNSDNTIDETAVAFTGDYIVDADYLKSVIGNENVIIIDARGSEAAAEGTVEGSIAMTWQMMADVSTGKAGDAMWGTLLPADQLSTVLSTNGLSMDKEIIVFAAAQNGWGDDGRIVWGLLAAGYTNVKMVNGGYDYLVSAGVPTVKGATTPVASDVTVASIDKAHMINTDDLAANYDSYKVMDVRADEEYNGQTLYGEAKGGHLPGAIHIRFTDLFNEDGTLKSNAEITSLFTSAGLYPEDSIVTYCTKGIRSAYMQLIMEMCGYTNVMNYDESYYRWCAVNEVEQ